jgi:hypothetical protein
MSVRQRTHDLGIVKGTVLLWAASLLHSDWLGTFSRNQHF